MSPGECVEEHLSIFLEQTGIKKSDVDDYGLAVTILTGLKEDIPNAIIILLKNGTRIIYIV